jgi:hypothetical protein
MVAASMNNGAMENVVKEIPQVKAIDEFRRQCRRLAPVAAGGRSVPRRGKC